MNRMENSFNISLTVSGTELDLEALRYFIILTIPVEELSISGDVSSAVISCTTKEPWKVMEYCATVGTMDDIRISRTA